MEGKVNQHFLKKKADLFIINNQSYQPVRDYSELVPELYLADQHCKLGYLNVTGTKYEWKVQSQITHRTVLPEVVIVEWEICQDERVCC